MLAVARRLAVNHAAILIATYLLAQGSYFLFLIYLRANHSLEDVGQIILLFGVISLTFQFADFGNSPYGMKCISSGRESEFHRFRIGRALIAIPFVAYTGYISLLPTGIEDKSAIYSLTAFGALVFGLSNPLQFEHKGNLFKLSLAQAFPWLATIAIFIGTQIFDFDTIATLCTWLLVPILFFLFTRNKANKSASLQRLTPLIIVGPIIMLTPALIGQFWGRAMLATIAASSTVSAIAAIGILRSVHTAISLAINFMIRAESRKLIVDHNTRSDQKLYLLRLSKKARTPIAISVIAILMGGLATNWMPADIKYWYPVLFGAPFWATSAIFTSTNQAFLTPKLFGSIEIGGMLLHIGAFILTAPYTGAWTFVIADASRALLLFASSYYFTRQSSE